jgi:hypothetical protein
MAQPQQYERDKNGQRFQPGGIDTVHPLDSLEPNKYSYLQNIRALKQGQIVSRSTEGAAIYSALPTPINSLTILNDTTPGGPAGGFIRVIGAAGAMYVAGNRIGTGYSGNEIAFCPFRPNASVQPWIYTGDPSEDVTITTKFLIDNGPTTYPLAVTPTSYCFGATKVRSDGLIFKTGIEEPQIAPTVTTQDTTTTGTDDLPATTIPWTNVGGANPSPYNYGQTNASDGTAPVIITGDAPELIAGSTITLTVTGTATVNGNPAATPATAGPTGPTYPGGTSGISGTPSIIVGAFTDTAGNVVAPGGSLPLVFFIGAGTTVTVPSGASQLQIGIDSSANSFSANSGNFTVNWSVTVAAIATVISTLGNVTANVWGTPPPAGGGSPHSGPVGEYIWKNPNDTGSGMPRSLTDPVPDTSPTNNSWSMQSPTNNTTPVNWNVLNPDGSVASTIQLFNPALETEGYQDFNACVTGSLFVPTAGTYQFSLQYKDQIMFGISGGASATVTGGAAAVPASRGQTITVLSSLPILFVGGGTSGSDTSPALTTNLNITFPATGVYDVEIDWDYWDKDQATLIMTAVSTSPNSPTIPPLPIGVRTGVSYRYVYRSTATGAVSNPSPESPSQSTPVLANTVTPVYSPDPQVDVIDYYRIDEGLDNFTYVATGPNTEPPTPITDELTDLEVAANQILDFDNYEPFPVIDLPHKGIINVTGGQITWVSGDQFNTRWLPGTLIQIGSPTSLAYSLYSRPTSTTTMIIPGVPDGTNLAYEIPEPDLAAQPLPYLWGPTDNVAYMFAVGDELNPGTLYFTKGNNPDSAPQTNQIPVTSPDEALINGVKTAAMSMVWTAERRWLIYPTYDQALATVEGVEGTPFNVVEATGSKGLYIPNCVCTDGGDTAFFRAKDGIYACEFGGQDVCITNDIYNLFPREGVVPQPITIGAYTIYPPNDDIPEAQQLTYADTVLYYDYADATGTPRTLVFDLIGKGWVPDVYQFPVTTHAWEKGPNTDTVMVGCTDGSVRLFGSGNPEVAVSVVATGSQNAGDARAFKRLGDIFIKAIVQPTSVINVALYANRYGTTITGFSPAALAGTTGGLLPYIIDFIDGYGDELIDVGMVLNWPTAAGNVLDLWQPSFSVFPEATQDRPTVWEDCGTPGNKFIQGLLLEANTFSNAKAIAIQRSDDFAIFTPNESPITAAHQVIIPLTFTPPFLAHQVRIISTDGVLWRHGPDLGWQCQWVMEPYPESVVEWQSEYTSHGLMGWQHIREMNIAYASTTDLTLELDFRGGPTDGLPTITLTIPASGGLQTKYKTPIPANKFKLIAYRLSSASPFFLFKSRCEAKVKWWGSSANYQIITPFGGPEGSPDAAI